MNFVYIKKEYIVATRSYLQQGKDGFVSFVDCPIIVIILNIKKNQKY